MIRTASLALLGVLLTAGGVFAQQHGQEQRPDSSSLGAARSQMMQGPMMGRMGHGMMQGMMHGMMQGMARSGMHPMMSGQGMMMPDRDVMQRAMHLSPSQVLAQQEALGLTPSQIERLKGLLPAEAAQSDTMARMRDLRLELRRLFDAEPPNPSAVQAAAGELFALHAEIQAKHIADAAAVRGILTGAQREKAMLIMPRGMSSMMGGGMMGGNGMPSMMKSQQTDRPGAQHEEHHRERPDGGR